MGVDVGPRWTFDTSKAKPFFSDANIKEFESNSFFVTYIKPLNRYLAVTGHGDAWQVGIFDAPAPWGPWTTVAYYENWLGMSGGFFLSMSFPGKWMSSNGRKMWAVFSVHGNLRPQTYHDKIN